MFKIRLILGTSALALVVCSVQAGGDEVLLSQRKDFAQSGLDKGTLELEVLSGAFFSVDSGSNRPTIKYAVESVRSGIVLTKERASRLLAGNEELLLEFFGGPIFAGPGNGLGGATIIWRHNFPLSTLVPYFQVGAGGVYSDISRSQSESLVGSSVDFNLQASIGLRYRLNRAWSIQSELGYRHISNGGLTPHNSGLDSLGGALGLGLFF